MEYGIGDEDYFINTFGNAQLYLISPNGDNSGVGVEGQIELVDHTSKSKLLSGRMPTNDFEILVSKKIADNIVDTSYGQEQGIWSYTHLFFERMVVGDNDVHIVGVVDTDIMLIYMSRDLANLYKPINNTFIPYVFQNEESLVAGEMPLLGQVVVTEEIYLSLFGNNDYTGTWPKSILPYPYQISGVYESDNQLVLMHSEDMEEMRYASLSAVYVYSNNAADLAEDLGLLSGIKAIDVYQEAYNSAKSQQQIVLLSTLGTSALLIGFAMVGFYFVIRSSLISRIYEVSVYRALGVKKSEIFVSFIIEIFVLTTISTMVGYILGTMALSRLQGGLLGDFNFFLVTPVTVVAGIVIAYVINMLAGLFPVYMLLKKTPAQILSQYDI